ncbi:MAG: hypothetical protein H6756_12335 [Candidatus Omnitrophica bacterium]|nr:hypothetical protein [Candidatus Omnitrophota bacterium]
MSKNLRTIKRFPINLLLITIFGAIFTALSAPLIAEVSFRTAQRQWGEGEWERAERGFARAAALVPISSEYLVGYADFLWAKAEAAGDESDLHRVGPLYARAYEANPACAECLVKKGRYQLAAGNVNKALDDFRTARRLDPYGGDTTFRIAEAGHALLEQDLHNLKEVIALDKDYFTGPRGTTLIAAAFRDKLLGTPEAALLSELKERLAEYEGERDVVQPDQWLGMSLDGRTRFTDGKLNDAGTVDALVDLPKGKSTVTVRARGYPAGAVPPFMIVELDGRLIGHRFVDSEEWTDYVFEVNGPAGLKVLSVTLANNEHRSLKTLALQLHIERAWVR